MEKPAEMTKFDMLYWASIIVGILGMVIGWGELTQTVSGELAASGVAGADEMASGTLLAAAVFGVFISAALWFLVSKLRIGVMRWVLLAFTLYSVIGSVMSMGDSDLPMINQVSGILSLLLSVAALYFLFTPAARAWFAAKKA